MSTPRTKTAVSLKFRIWEYFIFFTAVVFIMLWFFQIVFLENFYEKMKIGIFGSDEIQIMIDELHIDDPAAIFFAKE